MEITTMKLSELSKPEKNVRIHTKQQLKEFARSIEMFGQIRPIVTDEKKVILAGSGLYDTLVMMGKETAAVYQYENLTEIQKKKLMIADNKIFSLGIENLDTLNCFLEEMQGDLDVPGFDEEILRQMVADADEVTVKIAEYGTLDEEEIHHIKEINEKREKLVAGEPAVTQIEEGKASDQGAAPEDEVAATADLRRFAICPKCGEKIWL